MADREKAIRGIERCLVCDTSVVAPPDAKKAYLDCEYTLGLYCVQDRLLHDALELLKEQKEREKAICKEICDFIRHGCSTDTEEDKDYVCHVIQQIFIHFGKE